MKENNPKILTLPLRLSLIVLIFGALFKIMHWPYAKELMLLGGTLIGLLYTIRFFNKKDKFQLDYVKVTFVLLWIFSSSFSNLQFTLCFRSLSAYSIYLVVY